MKQPKIAFWLAVAGFLVAGVFTACTDPTTIGADLLEEDRLGLDYVDTITLSVNVENPDSVLTYAGGGLSRHIFGDHTDPLFGRVLAGFYLQPTLQSDRLGFFPPDFKDAVLDSIILVLVKDSSAYYGRPVLPFGVEVFRLTEDMDPSKEYYSNSSFATQAAPLGAAGFLPRYDSISVIDYSGSAPQTQFYTNQVRIPLDLAFGTELIQQDTLVYRTDSTLAEVFKGLYIKPTHATDGLVAFSSLNTQVGLFIYYSNAAGNPVQYQFPIKDFRARVSRYQHSYAGFPIESYIGNPARSDTLVFTQGLAGVQVKVEMPHITSLRGAIINYAELEVPLGYFPDDDTVKYAPSRELLLLAYNSQGKLEAVSDVPLSGNQRAAFFGGILTRGAGGRPDVYRMNVSSQLADMISGRAPNTFYIQVFAKAQTGSRVALHGPRHPLNRMRLRVAFTQS